MPTLFFSRLIIFVMLLASIAASALRMGYLVRGGATIGNLSHEQGVVFGEALVDAHDLESRVAVYPRTLLSSHALKRLLPLTEGVQFVLELPSSAECEMSPFVKDFDGLYYCDYFKYLLLNAAEPGSSFKENVKAWFDAAIPAVSKNLVDLKAAGELNKLAKWEWFSRKFRAALTNAPKILEWLNISPADINPPE